MYVRLYDYKATRLYAHDALTVEKFREIPRYEWHIGGKGDTGEFTEWLRAKLIRNTPVRSETPAALVEKKVNSDTDKLQAIRYVAEWSDTYDEWAEARTFRVICNILDDSVTDLSKESLNQLIQ